MSSDQDADEIERPDTPGWNALQHRYEMIQRCEWIAQMAESAEHHFRRERYEEGVEKLNELHPEVVEALEEVSLYELQAEDEP